ncbi:uncharacterized protein [Typha angustifolia]|uniref:uncharacterized protein isoform X2 n=1 Tax=Typha angustifolia TaxID=59011 RepID=UPI003C2F9CBA
MDFKSMKRKQLQALCKKHGLPANSANSKMADDLTSLLLGDDKTKPKPKPKGCLKGSGGSIGEEGGRERGVSKKVSFLFPEENFDFDGRKEELDVRISPEKRRSSRRKSITVSEAEEKGASQCPRGAVRTRRSLSLSAAVVWSPVVGKDERRRKARGACQNGELPLFAILPCEDEEREGKEVKESCCDRLITRSLRNRVVVVREIETFPGDKKTSRNRKDEASFAKNLKQDDNLGRKDSHKRPRGAHEGGSSVPPCKEPPRRRSRRNLSKSENSLLDSDESSHGKVTKETSLGDQGAEDFQFDSFSMRSRRRSVAKANEAAHDISLVESGETVDEHVTFERRKSQRKGKKMDLNGKDLVDSGLRTKASSGAVAEKAQRRKPSKSKEPLRRSMRKSIVPTQLEEENSPAACQKFEDQDETVAESTSLSNANASEVARHELAIREESKLVVQSKEGLRSSRRTASEQNATDFEVSLAVSDGAILDKSSKEERKWRKRNAPDLENSLTVHENSPYDESIEKNKLRKQHIDQVLSKSSYETEALEDDEKFKEPRRRSRRNGSRNQSGDTAILVSETAVDENIGRKKPAKRTRVAVSEEVVSVVDRTSVMANQDNGRADECNKNSSRKNCKNVHDDGAGHGELSSASTHLLSSKETTRMSDVTDKGSIIAASHGNLSRQTHENNNEKTPIDGGCRSLEAQRCISGEVQSVASASLHFTGVLDRSLGVADIFPSTFLSVVQEGGIPVNQCSDGTDMTSCSGVLDSLVTDPCSDDQLQRAGNLLMMEALQNGLQSVGTETCIKDKHFNDLEIECDGREASFFESLDKFCEITTSSLEENEDLDAEPLVNVGGAVEVASESGYVSVEIASTALADTKESEKQVGDVESSRSNKMADNCVTSRYALKYEDVNEGYEELNNVDPLSSCNHIEGLPSPISIETSLLVDQKTPALIVAAHDARKAGSVGNGCLVNYTTDNQDKCHQLSTIAAVNDSKDLLEQENDFKPCGVAPETTLYSELASKEFKDARSFDTVCLVDCSLPVSEVATKEAKICDPYEARNSLLSDNSTLAVCPDHQVLSLQSGTPEVGRAALDFRGPNSCDNLSPCITLIGCHEESSLSTCSLLEENKPHGETSVDKYVEKIITDIEAPSCGVFPAARLQENGRGMSIKEVTLDDVSFNSCKKQRSSPVSNMAVNGGELASSFVILTSAVKRTSVELEEKSSDPSIENPYEDDRDYFISPITTNVHHMHLNYQDFKDLAEAAGFSSGSQVTKDSSSSLPDILYKETDKQDNVTTSNSAAKEFSLFRSAEETQVVQCDKVPKSSCSPNIKELASGTDSHSPLFLKDSETERMHLKGLTVASEDHQEAASEADTVTFIINDECKSADADGIVDLKIAQYNVLEKPASINCSLSDTKDYNLMFDRGIQLSSEDAAEKLPVNVSYSIVSNECKGEESSETKENISSHGNFEGDTTQKLGDFSGLCHASVVYFDSSQDFCQGLNGVVTAASSASLPEYRIKDNDSADNRCDNGRGDAAVCSTSVVKVMLSETEGNLDCSHNFASSEAIENFSSTPRHSLVGIEILFTQECKETSLTNGEFALGKVDCENYTVTKLRDYDIYSGDERIAAVQPTSDCGHHEEDKVGEKNEGNMKLSPEHDDSTALEDMIGKLGSAKKVPVVSRSPESKFEEWWIAPGAQIDLLRDLFDTEMQKSTVIRDNPHTAVHECRFDRESFDFEGETPEHSKDTDKAIELREEDELKSMTISNVQIEFEEQASSVGLNGDFDRNLDGCGSETSPEVGNLSGISTPEAVNCLDCQDLLPLREKSSCQQVDVFDHREDDQVKFDQAVLSELEGIEEVCANEHDIQDDGADLFCKCAVDAKAEDNEKECYVNTTELESTTDVPISRASTASQGPASEECIKRYAIEDINQVFEGKSDKELADEVAPEVSTTEIPAIITAIKDSSSSQVKLPQEHFGDVRKSSPETSSGNKTLNNLVQVNCQVDSYQLKQFSSCLSVNHSPIESTNGTDKNAYKSEELCGTAYEMEEINQKLIRFRISSARKASKPDMKKSTPVKLVKNLKIESVLNGARGKENTPAIKMDQSCKNNLNKSVRNSSSRRPLQSVRISKLEQ